MQSLPPVGKLPAAMSDERVQIGDRVITMQMPGIFTVASRTGHVIRIVSDDGVELTVADASVRRLDGAEAATADDTAGD